jgi:hypothetical protein
VVAADQDIADADRDRDAALERGHRPP